MEKCYVVLDAHHEYAVALIERIYRQFGLRALCVFGDRKREFYTRQAYPTLQSHLVAERFYAADDSALTDLSVALAARYEVVAVVPHAEWTVRRAALLQEALG